MDDQQKKKTETIIALTVLALFLTLLHISLRWLPDDVADRNPVVALVFLLAFPGVLICTIGVIRAMRGWSVHWLVKLVVILILVLPFLTCAFTGWAMLFFL
jgi:hypothetical protein